MKLFEDGELHKPILNEINLGIVNAGETKRYEYYLHNSLNAEVIDIVPRIELLERNLNESNLQNASFPAKDEKIEIIEHPKSLKKNESGKIIFEWTPSVSVKVGIKAILEISTREIYE